LRDYNKTLEAQVAERTEKLRAQNDELTRLNRLMTGREVKMVELKKEIKNLKGRLGEPDSSGTDDVSESA
ncbi:MAG TPA: hypothetical protein VMC43_03820, partial [Candidatus Paceibacterota bacterium]|nr:hypothetical protein [Candidatus Paceibacterota bacterium]